MCPVAEVLDTGAEVRMAEQDGLIDQFGGIDEAKDYISQKIGEEAVVCD